MSRRTQQRNMIGDLTDRGMIAFNCGRRMAATGFPEGVWRRWMTLKPRRVLTDDEYAAWLSLLPATWSAQWVRGWRDGKAGE